MLRHFTPDVKGKIHFLLPDSFKFRELISTLDKMNGIIADLVRYLPFGDYLSAVHVSRALLRCGIRDIRCEHEKILDKYKIYGNFRTDGKQVYDLSNDRITWNWLIRNCRNISFTGVELGFAIRLPIVRIYQGIQSLDSFIGEESANFARSDRAEAASRAREIWNCISYKQNPNKYLHRSEIPQSEFDANIYIQNPNITWNDIAGDIYVDKLLRACRDNYKLIDICKRLLPGDNMISHDQQMLRCMCGLMSDDEMQDYVLSIRWHIMILPTEYLMRNPGILNLSNEYGVRSIARRPGLDWKIFLSITNPEMRMYAIMHSGITLEEFGELRR